MKKNFVFVFIGIVIAIPEVCLIMTSENIKKNKLKFLSLFTCSFLILMGLLSILPNYDQDLIYAQDSQTNDSKNLQETKTLHNLQAGDILVIDGDLNSVIKIDPITGKAINISNNHISPLGIFNDLTGITIDIWGNIYVIDDDAGCGKGPAVIKVNQKTGIQNLVSDNCMASSSHLTKPVGLEVNKEGDIFILNKDNENFNVIKIKPQSGTQEIVYETRNFFTDSVVKINDMVINNSNEIFLVGKIDEEGVVIKVNPINGTQKIISDNRISPPGFLIKPEGITLDPVGNLLINDADSGTNSSHAIIRVDPDSGLQRLISDNEISNPGLFVDLSGIDFYSNDEVVVIDEDTHSIIRVNLLNGQHFLISNNSLSSLGFEDLEDVKIFPKILKPSLDESISTSLEPKIPDGDSTYKNDSKILSAGDIIVLDNDALAIIKVDPVTGEQTLISDNSISSEINFEDVVGVAINSDGEIIVADEDAGCDLDGLDGAIIKVDSNTGIRTLVSDNCTSEVGLFSDLEAVAIDSENNIVVLDEKSKKSLVIMVNPNTGNHTLIYDSGNYHGLLADFEDLTIDQHGHIILAGKIKGEPAVVRVNPNTGKHTIISDNRISQPGLLTNPIGIAIDKNGEILVIDNDAGPSLKSAVIKINPNTGIQSLLSHNEISDLDLLIKVKGIAVDPDGNIIVGDDDEKTVIKIDSKTGNQELISDNNISSNKLFDDIEDVAVIDPGFKKGTIVISDGNIQSIPDSPANLVSEFLPIEGFDNAIDVRLDWNPPISDGGSPIIWYEIQRQESTSSEGLGTYSFLARTNETSFIDPVGLMILNYHYSYRVTATNLVGVSEFSNSVFASLYRESYKVETVAEDLEIPWAIAFAPDGRIFVTERIGQLRVIDDGVLNPQPIMILDVGTGEGGLLGITLDPNFEENHYLYLYYTYNDFFSTFNKVVRYTESDNQLSEEKILLDKIPGASDHNGGRIKFGPDGKLYITTGIAGDSANAQDLNSLGGKILRMNSDGTIPDDNPFPNSPVYSLGHRNPQGLDWDPVTGKLVISEHGPSMPIKGRFAHDEVNVIESGKNYGWPEVIGDEADPKYQSPFLHTGNVTWAPSGSSFYKSSNIPEWENKFVIATLKGKHIRMLDMDLEENKVISSKALFLGEFGRLRDASVGPDGDLYILTSNLDGRGSPAPNDDRILRITPVTQTIEEDLLSPLKQFNLGIAPLDVKCRTGFELLLKSTTGTPACVKPQSVEKLVERGWLR